MPNRSELPSAPGADAALCGYTEECNLARFLLVSAACTAALLGLAANSLLVFVFKARRAKNTPPTLYPTVLAVLDATICLLYIMLFGVDVWSIYMRIESLFVIYHVYIVPAFVLSKFTQLVIPYMLIFVTLERYAWISKHCFSEWFFSRTGRVLNLALCLFCGALLRLPPVFALTVEVYPDCADFFRTLAVSYREWALTDEWFNVYDLHVIGAIQILIPFVVLVILNTVIVRKLLSVDKQEKTTKMFPGVFLELDSGSSRHSGSFKVIKQALRGGAGLSVQVRHAVYTTVTIVTSYLICSGLHLLLTALEKTDSELLKRDDDPTKASLFYTVCGDMISFLYMFTSAIRILIYCKCNPAVREHVLAALQPRGPWEGGRVALAAQPAPV